jgi:hypothetical protein
MICDPDMALRVENGRPHQGMTYPIPVSSSDHTVFGGRVNDCARASAGVGVF